MAGFTDTFMNTLLDEYFGDQPADTPPVTWYVGLFTTNPADDGTGGVEAAWSGYARIAVTNDLTEWPAAAAGAKSNANLLDYGVAGSGPTFITSIGLFDDPAAGNLWYWNPLTGAPITVASGGDATFPPGSVIIGRCA